MVPSSNLTETLALPRTEALTLMMASWDEEEVDLAEAEEEEVVEEVVEAVSEEVEGGSVATRVAVSTVEFDTVTATTLVPAGQPTYSLARDCAHDCLAGGG